MYNVEKEVRFFYETVKKDLPDLNRITFEIAGRTTGVETTGFYHVGCECYLYCSVNELVSELNEIIRRRRILFQKFHKF